MTNIQLLSAEVRDLGKLVLQLGTQSEQVTVTAEVTPVQVATSARTSALTNDQLTNIQMKGRDVYGLLAILPGVQDTNLNRDFTTWTSMRDATAQGFCPPTASNLRARMESHATRKQAVDRRAARLGRGGIHCRTIRRPTARSTSP